MYCNVRVLDILVLQVVFLYEYGEFILKKYKEIIILFRFFVFFFGGILSFSEVLLSKDVVYSEVCVFFCIFFVKIVDDFVGLCLLICVVCNM